MMPPSSSSSSSLCLAGSTATRIARDGSADSPSALFEDNTYGHTSSNSRAARADAALAEAAANGYGVDDMSAAAGPAAERLHEGSSGGSAGTLSISYSSALFGAIAQQRATVEK